MKKSVLVSSTVYYFADLRAELKEFLAEKGYIPLLNEDTENFKVQLGVDSYTACVEQVKKANLFILIIGKRYGGIVEGQEISITELEYQTACENNIPRINFCRKEVWDLLQIYQKNPDMNFLKQYENGDKIMAFLNRIRRYEKDKTDNWVHPFSSSVNLKNILSTQLEDWPDVSHPSPEEVTDKMKDKIKDHQSFIIHKLENIEKYGYMYVYCYPNKTVSITEDRFKETFLSYKKGYSEYLDFSKKGEAFSLGYTRGYFPQNKNNLSTYRTTCYYNGFIALDCQIDIDLENKKLLKLPKFAYIIQRHLQLTKEVLEGYSEEIFINLNFDYINEFFIFRDDSFYKYQGMHNPITKKIKISEISGREQWNTVFPAVTDIIEKIVRIFGMEKCPSNYCWDDKGILIYANVTIGR